MNLILSQHTKDAIDINELAYFLEKSNPHLGFFQINELVRKTLLNNTRAKTQLSLVEFPEVQLKWGRENK